MSTKYLRELVDFAQKELPQLGYELQNASTVYALQAATQRLYNVTTYMLHHIVHAAYEQGGAPAAPPAPPAPAPVAVPVPPAPVFVAPSVQTGLPALPPPSLITQPIPGAQSTITTAGDVPSTPGVANVIITPQGTKVVAPSGVATMVPPGEPVGLDATVGAPPVPLSVPGEATIVLPPGGGISPDLAAALSNLTRPPTP